VPALTAPTSTIARKHHNFSGGPGALPDSVLLEAQRAIAEVPGVGLSILGISHRSRWVREVVDEAAENIRLLLGLSKHYHVLFLQGGSTLQFSMIPMSFLRGSRTPAEYLVSGHWSQKAIVEARREGPVRAIWDGADQRFTRLPIEDELRYTPGAPYFHYVSNETVEGLQFHRTLGRDGVPRVCDMSSDFLSRPCEPERFALIYAHAQKNLGPSGATLVVLHEDLLERVPKNLPVMLDYRAHIEHGSIYNTPPVFALYVILLVTRWLRDDIGGLDAMADLNRAKAERLYALIDSSDGFYVGRAARSDRSWMNVVFTLRDRSLEAQFLRQAEAASLYGLEGHRTIGGLRASLYNAVTLDAVEALCEFMDDFRARHAAI
jgi:phosphoserine aminotransferase